MATTQFGYSSYFPLFLLLLLLGCSDEGVRLDGFVPDQNSGVASLTIGDEGTCSSAPCLSGDWNDSFITPNGINSFTVAMKSAALIKQGDPDDSPSYTIFDSGDIASPTIVSFTPGTAQPFHTNPEPAPDGTYDRIQYVLSYIEMSIPINYQNGGSAQRRVRLYLAGYNDTALGQPVEQNDILFENPSGALNWIDPDVGLGNFIADKGTSSVFQLPEDQLGIPSAHDGSVDNLDEDPYTFTVTLVPPLTASSDTQTVVQLNLDTTMMFFFDETNGPGIIDPVSAATNINFNPPLRVCSKDGSFNTNEPCDGRLDAEPTADFWPGLPTVTATSSGGSATMTTTTISTTTTT